MTGPARIALFAAFLVALFAGALFAGAVLDPDTERPEDDEHAAAQGEHGAAPAGEGSAPPQRGLAIAQDGLRLAPSAASLPLGRTREFSFRIVDEGGRAVTDFALEHERRMHVIVVRRDLTGYQHLHPRMAADGTWSLDMRLDEPGPYRVYADFERGGRAVTLATDVAVAGDYSPRTLPPESHAARTAGYEVELADDGGAAVFTVARDGRPVDDLEPYLGARGHLVVLREGDLAYLHVHPEDEATIGREVRFGVEYPSAGRYRMFLQFQHEGRVHTAAFTKEGHGGDEH